ncbi:MAG: hypothetical protein U0528_09440 [Anaerolineae bacterium]|nr:hypothetical protein [Anaerolineae bacterium]
MTKKRTRKPNLSEEALMRARAELRGEAEAVSAAESNGTASAVASTATGATKARPAARPLATQSRRAPTTEELQREYTYVIRDLRNLLILSAAILVAILVIAIVLPPVTG